MTPAITLTAAQAETVLSALDDAAEARRERAAATCGDCAVHPVELCPDHEAELNRASEYDALAARLYAVLDGQPAGPGPVSDAAVRAAVAATDAGGGGGLWNLGGTGPEQAALEARKHIIRVALSASVVNGDH